MGDADQKTNDFYSNYSAVLQAQSIDYKTKANAD